jgi:glycine hydroxymethyltransferase
MQPEFKTYSQQVVSNAKKLAETLIARGFRLVSGGTDNHLLLVDVYKKGIMGRDAEKWLEAAGITVNKNAIPFDELPPLKASGIRIGSPALTTRGMKEAEMETIGAWIAEVLDAGGEEATVNRVREEIRNLTAQFPLYPHRTGAQAAASAAAAR